MESGVNARARDFGRFGMPFAKEGNWEGEQLISQGWIEQSTRARIGAPILPKATGISGG